MPQAAAVRLTADAGGSSRGTPCLSSDADGLTSSRMHACMSLILILISFHSLEQQSSSMLSCLLVAAATAVALHLHTQGAALCLCESMAPEGMRVRHSACKMQHKILQEVLAFVPRR